VLSKVGDNMVGVLGQMPRHKRPSVPFADPKRDRWHYEMRFNSLRDAIERQIGAYLFA
jgi:hypothetical protein